MAGIGCHAKIFDYLNISGFYGLHGRVLPVAQGIKIGESLAQTDEIPLAKEIIAKAQAKAKKGWVQITRADKPSWGNALSDVGGTVLSRHRV